VCGCVESDSCGWPCSEHVGWWPAIVALSAAAAASDPASDVTRCRAGWSIDGANISTASRRRAALRAGPLCTGSPCCMLQCVPPY